MSISKVVVAAMSALVALTLAACTNPGHTAASASSSPAATATEEPPTSEFDPGYIVSDDAFYDSSAMDEQDIQSFLEKVPCRADAGVHCLADYTETTVTQPAVGGDHCAEYRGGHRERASRILAKVAVACGISPQTLLVLLQKEQSLLTRPTASGFERATGYGCPDTADCEQKYFGFFNQVYNAAWQFRQYTEEPDRRFKIGTVDVGYNPDAECGGSPVDIRNQATANLYNYTPYQPSDATLADPDSGDACSAFGNLNFWRIWNRWFGNPEAERLPPFFPPCSRLVGGHTCPPATVPSVG